MPYSGPAVSAFQKLMRSKADVLRDHICKEMNDLNLERCRCDEDGFEAACCGCASQQSCVVELEVGTAVVCSFCHVRSSLTVHRSANYSCHSHTHESLLY
jgi:hypothetical protein